MRLRPKMPDTGFWRKWNMYCVMFVGGCLLATRFYKEVPEVVNSSENIMWLGMAGLALGFFMQFWNGRKKR